MQNKGHIVDKTRESYLAMVERICSRRFIRNIQEIILKQINTTLIFVPGMDWNIIQ